MEKKTKKQILIVTLSLFVIQYFSLSLLKLVPNDQFFFVATIVSLFLGECHSSDTVLSRRCNDGPKITRQIDSPGYCLPLIIETTDKIVCIYKT